MNYVTLDNCEEEKPDLENTDAKAYYRYFTSGNKFLLLISVLSLLTVIPLKVYSDYLLSNFTTLIIKRCNSVIRIIILTYHV